MNPNSIAFIGGGNMASAVIGGLRKAGRPAASIIVVEPFEAQRDKLAQAFGVAAQAAADACLLYTSTQQGFAAGVVRCLGGFFAQLVHR